jgi:hypothetical protein
MWATSVILKNLPIILTTYINKRPLGENSPNLVTLFGPFVKQVFLLLSRSLLDDFNNQYYCTNVNTYIYGF